MHKNNITQTDNHQYPCELFQSCSDNPNQNRSTIARQTFNTGTPLLSLQRTIKKTRKALNITLLKFLT